MRKFLFRCLALLVLGFTYLTTNAATEPIIQTYKFDDKGTINKMSDNGLWAVAFASNPSNSIYGMNPRLINLSNQSNVVLTEGIDPAAIISASVYDVTDDGSIAVGEYNMKPGYWNTSTKTWVELPLLKGSSGGAVMAVTPDGKYAIGNFTYEEFPDENYPYMETEALWNLETKEIIKVEGLPLLDMANENKKQNRFIEISADGNTIVGCMSISYWPTAQYAGGKCYYAYNWKEKSHTMIGFTPNDKGRWTPLENGITFIASATLNTAGNWITGAASMMDIVEGAEFSPEYGTPYIYNTETKAFTLLNDPTDNGFLGTCMTNDGTLLGASPDNNPYREWSIRSGKYWIPITQILKQKYNYDFIAKTGLENSGTPVSVSNDNRRIAVFVDPESSYVITLPEAVNTICNDINLLGNYAVAPAAGSEISKLQKISVTFDRNIEVLGGRNAVEIRNTEGQKVYSSIGFKAGDNEKSVSITFRNGALEANQTYTLHIPAESICLKGDNTKKNEEISIPYVGRASTPVVMVSAVPENDATIAKIDAASSPVIVTFDANIALTDEAKAKLYRADETAPFCDILMAAGGKEVALYPAVPQLLYKGAKYKVVIPAGCVTDVTGANANEEIVLNYTGAYEREISSDDKVLFSDDFNNGLNNFLLFDGDGNNPTDEMKAWDFANGTQFPWVPVRDDEGDDMAAASHSMYNPAGKSYDWMIVPQTFIPDQLCVLKFQSQSYLNNKNDKLKVIVWASDNVYNVLNKNIVDKIYKEGTVVYNEVQTPGANEGLLKDEWKENTIELKDFAGKNVYIAFLNENDRKSAIFINNVEVLHNIPFLVTFDNQTSVTAQSEIIIKGRITIDSETETYTSATLTLKNDKGNVIDVINANNLNLKKGDTYTFAFNHALPLTAGKVNNFSVDVKMNNTENNIKSSIKNLSFEPTKRVVLEEYTGMSCPNCPLGILAIEKIKSIYGDHFLPIAIHTYPGDQLGTGLDAYSNYFNFSGAPSGVIQRSGVISSPMVSVEQDYRFNGVNGDKLWLDLVQEEMSTPADADITATAQVDAEKNTIEVPCTIRYAMDTQNLNVNLFMVFVEENVIGFQQNNLSGMKDPDLGEFGANGKYAKSIVYPFYHNHVARGWYGNTFAGTGGLLPTSVVAGKDYTATIKTNLPENIKDINKTKVIIMMIDANTERVINAIEIAANSNTSGLEDTNSADIMIESFNHNLVVKTQQQAAVSIFTATGRTIAQTNGKGIQQINTQGFHGIAIVKVTTAQETIVKKVML